MCYLNYILMCVILAGSSSPGCTLSSSFEPFSPQCSSTSLSPTSLTLPHILPTTCITSQTACSSTSTSSSSSTPVSAENLDDKHCGPVPVIRLRGDFKHDLKGTPPSNIVEGLDIRPSQFHFGTTQMFVALTECLEIYNPSPDKSVEVVSITSQSIHFQVAAYAATALPPLARLRMPIMFLPRAKQHFVGKIIVGLRGSSVEIPVEGRGTKNLYHVKAFTNISIPVDTKITPPIHVYNPGDQPLHIKEIYTTESFLHLTLPENVGGAKLWEITPKKKRYVINLSFESEKTGLFIGFIHLSTEEHLIILPVEILVVQSPLNVIPREVNFGIITSAEQEQVRTIALCNLSLRPVVIMGMRTSRPSSMIVKFKRGLVIPPQTTILDAATFYYTTPTLKHADVSGKILITTNQNTSHKYLVFTYKVRIRPGFLRYPPRSLIFSSVATEQPLPEAWFDPGLYHRPTIMRTRRTIFMTNAFAVPLRVHSVTTEGSGFEVTGFSPLTVQSSGKFTATLYYYQNLSTASQKSYLFVSTNLSDFLLPMYVFSGHLDISSEAPLGPDDPDALVNTLSTFSLLPLGGTPMQGEGEVMSHLGILNFGYVVVGTERAHRFVITNHNPVPVTITRVRASSAILYSVFTTYPPDELSEWRSQGLELCDLPDQADALVSGLAMKSVPTTLEEEEEPSGEGLQLFPGDRVMVQISVIPVRTPSPPTRTALEDESEEEMEEPPEEEEEGGEFDSPIEPGGIIDEGPISVWIDTNLRQGDISIRVHAKGVLGSLDLEPVVFTGMFPGRIGNQSVIATNRYPVPIELILLKSSDPRLTPVLTAKVIQPGEKLAIGYVLVIPSQWSAENNYMSDLHRDDGEDEETGGAKEVPPRRDVEAVKRSAERWAKLKAEGQTVVRATIQLWSSVVGWSSVDATVDLVTPSLTDRTSLQFDLLQVNTSKSVYVQVHNPSDETVSIEALPPASSSPFTLLKTGLKKTQPLSLGPHKSGSVGPVVFSPVSVGSFSAKLFLKNNLTRLSELQLHGVGGSGHLQFKRPLSLDNQSTLQGVTIGGRKVGLADISRLDINFSRYLPSLGLGMTESGSLYRLDPTGVGVFHSVLPLFVASVPFFVLNSGNLPFTISSFSLHGKGHSPLDIVPFNFSTLPGPAREAEGAGVSKRVEPNKSMVAHHGFYIHGCEILPMLLEPQNSMPLRVVLDPFKLADALPLVDVESLNVHTSWGTYSIPLELSVPNQMMPLFHSLAPPSAPENILRYSLVISAIWLVASLMFQLKEQCQAGYRSRGATGAPNIASLLTDTIEDEGEEEERLSLSTPNPPSRQTSAHTPTGEEGDEQVEGESVTPKAKKAKKKKKKTTESASTTPTTALVTATLIPTATTTATTSINSSTTTVNTRRSSDVDISSPPRPDNHATHHHQYHTLKKRSSSSSSTEPKEKDSPLISPSLPSSNSNKLESKSPSIAKQDLVTTTALPLLPLHPATPTLHQPASTASISTSTTTHTTSSASTISATTSIVSTAPSTPPHSANTTTASSTNPSPQSKVPAAPKLVSKPPKVPEASRVESKDASNLRTSEIIRMEQVRQSEQQKTHEWRAQEDTRQAQENKAQAEREQREREEQQQQYQYQQPQHNLQLHRLFNEKQLANEKEAAMRFAIEREKANDLARINAEKAAVERATAAMSAEKRDRAIDDGLSLSQRQHISFTQPRLSLDRTSRRHTRLDQKPIGLPELPSNVRMNPMQADNGRMASMQSERKRSELDRGRLDLSLANPESFTMRPRAGSLVDAPLPLQIDASPPEPSYLPPRRPVVQFDMPPPKFLQPNLRPNFRAPGGPIPGSSPLDSAAFAVDRASLPSAPTPLTRRDSLPVNTSPHDSPVMFGQLAGGWQPPLATGPLPPLSLRRESSMPQMMPVGIRGLKADVGGNLPHSSGIAVSMMGGMAPLQLQLSGDSSPLNLANSDDIDQEFGSSLFSSSLLNSPPSNYRNFSSSGHEHSSNVSSSTSIFPGFRTNHSSFINPLPPPIGVRKPPPGLPPPGMPFPSRPFTEDRI